MVKLIHHLLPASKLFFTSSYKLPPLTRPTTPFSQLYTTTTTTTMSVNLHTHAFAGNTLRSKPGDPTAALEALKTRISVISAAAALLPNLKVLPFRNGKPLASSTGGLGWIGLEDLKGMLVGAAAELSGDSFVYLGSHRANRDDDDGDDAYWAIDVSGFERASVLVPERLCFVELRTLMVATDWVDDTAMGNLAIAGHARALLEWHNLSRFCGHCGEKTVPMEAGRRKECSNESCKKRIYPRIDPVVIMLVIDRDNDRVLLGKQSRFVPRMWSCLAGFIEPGESLEEAVRRETLEETGIEVGEVVYHSSQPWPVGPNSMPCQLMVGFFAYAKSLEINVDKEELEDARWHSREDIRKALTFAEYKKAQETAAAKVEQMCKGVEKTHSLTTDFNVESGELAPMFVPGPFAIAHHLISSWAFPNQNVNGVECHSKQRSGSVSNL